MIKFVVLPLAARRQHGFDALSRRCRCAVLLLGRGEATARVSRGQKESGGEDADRGTVSRAGTMRLSFLCFYVSSMFRYVLMNQRAPFSFDNIAN